MPDVVTRPYTPSDDEGFRHVRGMVYRNGEAVSPDDKLIRSDSMAFVAEYQGEIAGASTVLDMTATKSGGVLRCAGIAGVGVLPEKRRVGVGSSMMAQILPLLREEGFQLASLYPFRGAYYRRFGYEFCGTRYAISCPTGRLPKFDFELEPRLLVGEDRNHIAACYEKFARRYAGMNIRREEQWQVLGGKNPLQVYAVGDPIEGYIVLRLSSDFWDVQGIREFAWTTDRAYRSLLGFFSALAMNKTAVEWREPGDCPFYARYMDQGVTISVDNNIMFRIVDVAKSIVAVKSDEEGEFSFSVIDPQVPQNAGPWNVCFGPAGTRVEKSGQADFEIPVGALTQAFLGEPSFQTLLSSGAVLVHNPSALHSANRFFKADRVYCMDFF